MSAQWSYQVATKMSETVKRACVWRDKTPSPSFLMNVSPRLIQQNAPGTMLDHHITGLTTHGNQIHSSDLPGNRPL